MIEDIKKYIMKIWHFWIIQIFFLTFTNLRYQINCYEFPIRRNLGICFELSCVEKILNTQAPQATYQTQSIIVTFVTIDVTTDSYLTLYLGTVMNQLDGIEPFNFYFVVLQCPKNLNIIETSVQLLKILPEKSIFVSIEHGKSSFGIYNLDISKSSFNYSTKVIYHLNHEQPWFFLKNINKNNNNNAESLDYTYDTIDELINSYSKHSLVIRNYYYKPLLKNSYYLPVFAPIYGYMIGNKSSTVFSAHKTLPSKRTNFCHFEGRLEYNNLLKLKIKEEANIHEFETITDIINNKLNQLQKISEQCTYNDLNKKNCFNTNNISKNNSSPQEMERRTLFKLAQRGKLGNCTVIEVKDDDNNENLNNNSNNSENNSRKVIYEKYIIKMSKTIFVPCPSGNNFETFRHYEVFFFFF
jgi:hypothetical protein